MSKRIGILSGTFDPIHIGHIEACLVARGAHELDKVVVMIEKTPSQKKDVTQYRHRKKMVELALEDFDTVELIDTKEDNLTFEATPAYLKKKFPGAEFALIVGTDMLELMPKWPGFDEWANEQSIIALLRDNKEAKQTKKLAKEWAKTYPKLQLSILPAVWSPIASSSIRTEIKKTGHSDLIHRKVQDYIIQNKLY